MTVQAETFNDQIASAIQAQLRELGVSVNIESLDRASYFNQLFSGNQQSWLFFYLWPVPMDVVTLFVNSAAAGGAGPNWANARSQRIDDAITAYQSAPDEAAYLAASGELQLAIAEELAFIPVVNRDAFWVNRNNVHGYLVHQWNLYPYYNDVWLSA